MSFGHTLLGGTPGLNRDDAVSDFFYADRQIQAGLPGAGQQLGQIPFRYADTLGKGRLRDAGGGDVALQQFRAGGEWCDDGLHSDNVCTVPTCPSSHRFAMSQSRQRKKRATPKPMKYRIKELRLARGWTQSHLAQLAGTDKGYISQLENGKRDPSAETLRSLAAAFDVEAAHLIESSTPSGAATVRLLAAFEQLSTADQEYLQSLAERLASRLGEHKDD